MDTEKQEKELGLFDYLSKAELQPSVNRLKGILNKLAKNEPLEDSHVNAILAILFDIIDKAEDAEDELEDEMENNLNNLNTRMLS